MFLLSLLACNMSPRPVDHITEVVAALDASTLVAAASKQQAIAHDDKSACIAWSTVAVAAPVASNVLLQVKTGVPTEIPGIKFSADECVSVKPISVEKIHEYMDLSITAADHIVASWSPSASECVAYGVTKAALGYVRGAYVPVLKSISTGVTTFVIPAQVLKLECK